MIAVLALASCTSKSGAGTDAPENGLADSVAVAAPTLDGQWNLEEIALGDSTRIRPSDGLPEQYITFTDNSYSIQTNCNTLAGEYSLVGDSISFGDGLMTEMACENMNVEDALRQLLPVITTVTVENDSTIRLSGATPTDYIVIRKAAVTR